MRQYFLTRRGAEEIERERLALLERYHDPFTVRQLDAIGVGDGWHCLDVGAGGGSVTRLLADRVGERGSVLATDLDPRLLEPLADCRIQVLCHNLLTDPLPPAAFDLALGATDHEIDMAERLTLSPIAAYSKCPLQ